MMNACTYGGFEGDFDGLLSGLDFNEKVTGKCSEENKTDYKESIITRMELHNIIEDVFGEKIKSATLVTSLINSIPERPVELRSNHTLFSSFNNGEIRDEIYSRQLLKLGLEISNQLGADSTFNSLCPNIDSCITNFKSNFASKLWRRPLSLEELNLNLISGFSFTNSLEDRKNLFAILLGATLASPQFYYKNILEKKTNNVDNYYEYEGYALASRLSFFLYNSIPDARLLELAKSGDLSKKSVILSEIDRILAEPLFKSRFIKDVLMKIFSVYEDHSSVDLITNDEGVSVAKKDFAKQIYLQLENILDNNLNLSKMINGDVVCTNRKISSFLKNYNSSIVPKTFSPIAPSYVDNIYSSLLANPLFLKRAKNGNGKTLVSRRGMVLYETLLCKLIPINEPDPDIIKGVLGHAPLTQIEISKIRISHSTCKRCHKNSDRIGIPMEHINDFGQYRDVYIDNTPISYSIDLLPGNTNTMMTNFSDFLEHLSQDQRFQECMVTKLKSKFKTANLVRPQQCSEEIAEFSKHGGLVDLIKNIVSNELFSIVEVKYNE